MTPPGGVLRWLGLKGRVAHGQLLRMHTSGFGHFDMQLGEGLDGKVDLGFKIEQVEGPSEP